MNTLLPDACPMLRLGGLFCPSNPGLFICNAMPTACPNTGYGDPSYVLLQLWFKPQAPDHALTFPALSWAGLDPEQVCPLEGKANLGSSGSLWGCPEGQGIPTCLLGKGRSADVRAQLRAGREG